jgi:cytidine deaminase
MPRKLSKAIEKELKVQARLASLFSYSPYSKCRVGAAVLTKSGRIYTGCNIENASYGATMCAERVAIYKALSVGDCKLVAIAIFHDGKELFLPCGICRQVVSEFSKNLIIYCDCMDEEKTSSIKELLPDAFKLKK